MRRAAKVDRNQGQIVEALRKVGASVQPLHTVGRGCPDLLVGHRGVNYLLELKDGTAPPSRRQMTGEQVEWHANWAGQVCVVETVEEALRAIGARRSYGVEPDLTGPHPSPLYDGLNDLAKRDARRAANRRAIGAVRP